jgi:hypothetical protein
MFWLGLFAQIKAFASCNTPSISLHYHPIAARLFCSRLDIISCAAAVLEFADHQHNADLQTPPTAISSVVHRKKGGVT